MVSAVPVFILLLPVCFLAALIILSSMFLFRQHSFAKSWYEFESRKDESELLHCLISNREGPGTSV